MNCPNKGTKLYKRIEREYGERAAYAAFLAMSKAEFTRWFGNGRVDDEGMPNIDSNYIITSEKGSQFSLFRTFPEDADRKTDFAYRRTKEDADIAYDRLIRTYGEGYVFKPVRKSDGRYMITYNAPTPKVDIEFFQLPISGDQKSIVDKLKATQSEIQAPGYTTEEDNRYKKADGTIIQNRITDKQTKEFERRVGKDKAKAINTNPVNVMKKELGTDIHDALESIKKEIVDGESPKDLSSIMSSEAAKNLREGVKNVVNQLEDIQKSIDSTGKVVIRTENRIFDDQRDLAGSMDMVAIFSDGSAAIVDWKTISFKTENGKIIETRVKPSKIKSYDLQMSDYKKILKEKYGVKKFRLTRVVPIGVQLFYDKKEKTYKKFARKAEMGGASSHLRQIPLANELTGDKSLDEFLTKLMKVRDSLKTKLSKDTKNEMLKARIFKIDESIVEIQLNKSLSGVLSELRHIIKEANSRIAKVKGEEGYITDAELLEYIDVLEGYREVSVSSRESMRKLQQENPEEFDKVYTDMIKIVDAADGMSKDLRDLMRERTIEEAKSEGIDNLGELQVESGGLSNWFNSLSQFDHPIFQRLHDFVKKIVSDKRRDLNKLRDEVEVKVRALEDWGRSHGLSGIAIYEKLINPKTGSLANMFSDEFREAKNKAREEKNIKWMKANLEKVADYDKKFEEAKKKRFADIDYYYKGESMSMSMSKYREELREEWLDQNDLKRDSAWLAKNNFFLVVKASEKEKWYSPEYKYIAANKPLLDFYDYHKSKMSEWKKVLPHKIKDNFIPNIKNDILDTIAHNGVGSVKGMGKSLINSLEVQLNDDVFGSGTSTDPITGEETPNIPVLYIDPIRDVNGEIDHTQKSHDLGRSLLLFGHMVSNYEHVSKYEAQARVLREMLATQKQILTDKLGRPLMDEISGELQTAIGSPDTLKTFDRFLNYYMYGQKIQGKDVAIKIGEKTISGSKAILGAMSYFSTKSLALAPVSGVVNLIGAKANAYMTGAKGVFYTNKQMRKAQSMIASNNKKFKAVAAYFEVRADDHSFRKANELSVSKITKYATADNAFILQRKGDELVEDTILVAMMQNHGLDNNGKIVKISKLPEGSKSLLDLVEIKEDKVHIEGLKQGEFDKFRDKIRYVSGSVKGTSSSDDINAIQTHIGGRILMQFRSWIPRLVKERFGETRYNRVTEEYESGRYRVFFSEIISKNFLPTVAELSKNLVSFGFAGKFSNYNTDRAKVLYDEYVKEQKALGKEVKMTLEDYIDARKSQMKAMAVEVRMFCIVLAAAIALGMDWDDDGKKDYKEYAAAVYALRLLDRTQDELGFFFSPSSVDNILKRPVPIFGLLNDVYKWGANTVDEVGDSIIGEDSKRDKKGYGYYTTKLFPYSNSGRQVLDIFEEATNNDDKN